MIKPRIFSIPNFDKHVLWALPQALVLRSSYGPHLYAWMKRYPLPSSCSGATEIRIPTDGEQLRQAAIIFCRFWLIFLWLTSGTATAEDIRSTVHALLIAAPHKGDLLYEQSKKTVEHFKKTLENDSICPRLNLCVIAAVGDGPQGRHPDDILIALKTLKTKPQDTILVYLSGHGAYETSNDEHQGHYLAIGRDGQSPFLGLTCNNREEANGRVCVEKVHPGSRAARAGVPENMLLTEINNQPVRGREDYLQATKNAGYDEVIIKGRPSVAGGFARHERVWRLAADEATNKRSKLTRKEIWEAMAERVRLRVLITDSCFESGPAGSGGRSVEPQEAKFQTNIWQRLLLQSEGEISINGCSKNQSGWYTDEGLFSKSLLKVIELNGNDGGRNLVGVECWEHVLREALDSTSRNFQELKAGSSNVEINKQVDQNPHIFFSRLRNAF